MLDVIVEDTRGLLPGLRAREEAIRAAASAVGPTRDLVAALGTPELSIIAEFKRRSPSRGALNESMDPARQAARYADGGAAALSVLTEPFHFSGRASDLVDARAAVALPVLRKDFTLDPIQIWEARAMGADAVLLIVAILDDAALAELIECAATAQIHALVEVHDAEEAHRAIAAGATIVGVNNRNLSTFEVDITTAEIVAPILEQATVRVAESGIHGPADAARMRAAGYHALLVGEHLVTSGDPTAAIDALRSA